jgi:hypothetical protein
MRYYDSTREKRQGHLSSLRKMTFVIDLTQSPCNLNYVYLLLINHCFKFNP